MDDTKLSRYPLSSRLEIVAYALVTSAWVGAEMKLAPVLAARAFITLVPFAPGVPTATVNSGMPRLLALSVTKFSVLIDALSTPSLITITALGPDGSVTPPGGDMKWSSATLIPS